jgi:hypothetical protein
MIVETLGHATLLLRDSDGTPLFFTDPWLTGSCYWRSWWLQHYPDEETLRDLARAPYAYITHEHPDHFHPPSVRKLGPGPTYLCPELPQDNMSRHLREQGFSARVIPAYTWFAVAPDVHVLSLPLYSDDSLLLVSTPTAVLINVNDAKPGPLLRRTLAQFLDEHAAGRRRVLLSSYSSASIVNSFFRDGRRLSILSKQEFIEKVCSTCRILGADDYLPFASQVAFHRDDSAWANDHRVTYADLRAHWSAPARLSAPYTRLDLETGETTSLPGDRYRVEAEARAARLSEQRRKEEGVELTDEDVARLEDKLRRSAPMLGTLFPRGVGFRIGDRALTYNPWTRRIKDGVAAGAFVMRVPPLPFKEALAFNHLGDLGITMFVDIEMRGRTDPRLVYAFFMLVTLEDYGHTASWPQFGRWVGRSIANAARRIPPPPAGRGAAVSPRRTAAPLAAAS